MNISNIFMVISEKNIFLIDIIPLTLYRSPSWIFGEKKGGGEGIGKRGGKGGNRKRFFQLLLGDGGGGDLHIEPDPPLSPQSDL